MEAEDLRCQRDANCVSVRCDQCYEVFFQPHHLTEHKKECLRRILKCPLEDISQCSWTGFQYILMEHLKESHAECLVEPHGDILLDVSTVDDDRHFLTVYTIEEHRFIFTFKIDAHNKKAYWCTQLIGSETSARQVLYRVQLFSRLDPARCISFVERCDSDSVKTDDVFRSGKCPNISTDTLATYIEDGKLAVKFSQRKERGLTGPCEVVMDKSEGTQSTSPLRKRCKLSHTGASQLTPPTLSCADTRLGNSTTLLDLPEDILAIIFKLLDLESKFNLWDACLELRRALSRRDVMQTVEVTSPMDCHPALRDLGQYVSELYAVMVPASNVKFCITYFYSNLRLLDVQDLFIWDVVDICWLCPQLTNLTVQFDWPSSADVAKRGEAYWRNRVQRLKTAWQNLHCVQFLLCDSDLLGHTLHMLQYCTSLHTLVLRSYGSADSGPYSDIGQTISDVIPSSLRVFSLDLWTKNKREIDICKLSMLFSFLDPKWHAVTSSYNIANADSLQSASVFSMSKKLHECLEMQPNRASQLTKQVFPDLMKHELVVFGAWHVSLEETNRNICENLSATFTDKDFSLFYNTHRFESNWAYHVYKAVGTTRCTCTWQTQSMMEMWKEGNP